MPALDEFGSRLQTLGWVTDLWVGGSAATGDYRPNVSDLDLVALVAEPVDAERTKLLTALHRDLDTGIASGLKLGCGYVNRARGSRADLDGTGPSYVGDR